MKRHAPPTTGSVPRSLRFLKNNSAMLLFWAFICITLIAFHVSEHQTEEKHDTNTLLPVLAALSATWLWSIRAWYRYKKNEVLDSYRMATESSIDGISILMAISDKQGNIVDFIISDCNSRGALFYGVDAATLIGMHLSDLTSEQHFPETMAAMRKALKLGYVEDELQGRSGHPQEPEWMHRKLLRTGTGIAMTLHDISERKTHERELWRMANEDSLTELPNRHWLTSFLPEAIKQARQANRMVAVLFIDLDDFKDVNDTLGHSAGDELLRMAAQRLKSVLRPGDHVARLGGDEFTVILSTVADRPTSAMVAQRIIDTFTTPFELGHGIDTVGISIGISLFPHDGDGAGDLLKNADIAMYCAKTAGKNRCQFYESRMSEALKARVDIERALHFAIERNEFVVYYQPRINATNGQLAGLEALVRWQHPVRGMVPPLEFIAIAEETGMIMAVGELVIEQVCKQIANWRDAGFPVVPVSINVSPRQFDKGNTKILFETCMLRHRIDAGLVEIEITESLMMGEQEELSHELRTIRALGIKLLVDDFGTGYSSLSQLQRLAMDVLKVDRAFTSELGKTTEGEVFFRAIVSMAHALGMTVVAEGVETVEQLHILQALNCDEIQGYLISRPVPASDVPDMLQQRYLQCHSKEIIFPAPAKTDIAL
ncbi:MAG: diguanylate cyclase (GGDEF)-like protein/PAS domain S-box-containing protein [Burkholderiaceae bacterium]|jgi:diguanylate cyclase (GGDEF)-like protein/PAS domain S-box-containing protein